MEQHQNTSPRVKVNCHIVYGQHKWWIDNNTEQCKHCGVEKAVWLGISDKTVKKIEKSDEKEDKRLANLIPWKPGQSGNPAGRPKGVKNLTTVVMEALRSKTIKVKDKNTGEITEMSGEQGFAEAVLENALKKKDRETLRMIWEHSDGKPTQRVEASVSGPKGYEVDEKQETTIIEQFGLVGDRYEPITTLKQVKTTHTERKALEVEEVPKGREITPEDTPQPTTEA